MNPDQIFALILVVTFGVVVPFGLALIIPAAKARARRSVLEAGGGGDSALADEVDQLRMRLGEVEERLDFAERLLAKQGESPGLER